MTHPFTNLAYPIVDKMRVWMRALNKGKWIKREDQDGEGWKQGECGLAIRGVGMKDMIVTMDYKDDLFLKWWLW